MRPRFNCCIINICFLSKMTSQFRKEKMTSQFRKGGDEEGLSEDVEEDLREPAQNNELFFEQHNHDESGAPDLLDQSIEERYR